MSCVIRGGSGTDTALIIIFPDPKRRLPIRLLEIWTLFEPWKVAARGYRIDAMHFVSNHIPNPLSRIKRELRSVFS